MYSKSSWAKNSGGLNLPARYSGVRFARSDGRNIDFPAVRREREDAPEKEAVTAAPHEAPPPAKAADEKNSAPDMLLNLFGKIGEDDILLAALIIVLAGEGRDENREAVLLLLLLLCIR